nr:hypothetical protein [Allomuricauda sp.]
MTNTKNVLRYLPSIGILIFIALYFYATLFYPGGSRAHVNATGFEWQNNHWCNLMAEKSVNGLENPARPIAIFALVVLCSSMILFFHKFADHFEEDKTWKMTIKVAGTLGMLSAIFIFTPLHNVLTTILSLCGGVVIIGMIRALHKRKLALFTIIGILCMAIVGLNNLFYYSESLTQYSPLIQKLGFVLILAWTVALNVKMNAK